MYNQLYSPQCCLVQFTEERSVRDLPERSEILIRLVTLLDNLLKRMYISMTVVNLID